MVSIRVAGVALLEPMQQLMSDEPAPRRQAARKRVHVDASAVLQSVYLATARLQAPVHELHGGDGQAAMHIAIVLQEIVLLLIGRRDRESSSGFVISNASRGSYIGDVAGVR